MPSSPRKPKGLFLLNLDSFNKIYSPADRQKIAQLVDIYAPLQTAEMVNAGPSILHDAELVFSGWGAPVFTEDLLAAAPNLKAVFYGAGSIKYLATDPFWARGIQITSAWGANAVPVTEYALANILLGLKCFYQHIQHVREKKGYVRLDVPGAYGSTVGLVSLGMIGKMMVERLKTYEVNIIAYDPYVPEYPGVHMCPLEEVFREADVVSVHTPWLKETEGLITGAHLASMKPYSTFINSSRGAVVCEAEMIDVLRKRPDLVAVIDVTHPEPPGPESPLYTLSNVILTPHIAGSMNKECERQGRVMVEELERYLAGQPLVYGLTKDKVRIMA